MKHNLKAIIFIHFLLSFTNALPAECTVVASPRVDDSKKTGKKQPSSFGDPTIWEEAESNQSNYQIEKFSLLEKGQLQVAEREYQIMNKLSKLHIPVIAPVTSCFILQEKNQPHTMLIYRESYEFNLSSDLLILKLKSQPLQVRTRFYSKLAGLIRLIHQQGIAHCNLKPRSFVSKALNMSVLKLNKLRYMVNSNEAHCGLNSKNFKPFDVINQVCLTPANVMKADVWNLALIILLIEDEKNTIGFEMLTKGSEKAVFNCFFNAAAQINCDQIIRGYVRQVLTKKAKKEREMMPLYRRYEKLLLSSFLGCEERISSEAFYDELTDISFTNIPEADITSAPVKSEGNGINHPYAFTVPALTEKRKFGHGSVIPNERPVTVSQSQTQTDDMALPKANRPKIFKKYI